MPYIIGTAGHIDHGKTSLIKALTGQDTDRLKEEKERGISIDLGFAHLDLPDETRVGIVDVPGHERFIHNMLAGAHGIDLVLFTVAADDGVMPQTEEHLDILHILGVQRAIFVITKADLVPEERIQEVEEEIQILAVGTSLENSPTVRFSFVSGQGLDELRNLINQTIRSRDKPEPPGYFRLPVDRAFVLQGHGTIVTGTALSGEVRVGDRIRCLPGQHLFRVRSLEVHNRPAEVARWGQRIGLNLSGHERPSIERGDVICHEKLALTSDRFDAYLETRPAATEGIKNHQRVRVHLGTAERMAKLILFGSQEKVGPKASTYCQIVMTQPLVALRGDRFIIRDETAQRTLGGGMVIHPWAKKHTRSERDLDEKLAVLHRGDPGRAVGVFLDESNECALPIASIYQFLNMREPEVQEQLDRTDTVRAFTFEGERLYALEAKWQRLKGQLLRAVRNFHAAHPLAPGMDMEELRDKLPGRIAPKLFRALVQQLEAEKAVVRDANLLHLPDHTIRLRDEEKTLVERIKALLRGNPLAPPDLKQIEKEMAIDRAKLTEMIRLMEREKSIVRVASELYFLGDCVEDVKSALRRHLSEKNDITPATFRDLFGTSRKYTIPLLEYFDREGVTVRVGDARRLKAPSRQVDHGRPA